MNIPRSLLLLIPLTLLACGPAEEPQVAPKERCAADGIKAYLEGKITDQDSTYTARFSADEEAPGSMEVDEIRIQIGQATPPDGGEPQPVILRLFDSNGTRHLMHRLSEALEVEPLTLHVADASDIGPGSQGRTSLANFDCPFDEGKICVQIGFDLDGDGLLHDEDSFAYNATGGTVTFLELDNRRRRLEVELDLELGPNALAFQDQSSGHLQGCLAPNYLRGQDLSWPLK